MTTTVTLWKAVVAVVTLFVLGVAAGAAVIDMLSEDDATTVTRAETATTVETKTVRRTRTVTAEDETALPSGWSLCTNNRARYAIGYPAGWYTTHLDAAQACEYFDPEAFEIVPGTEFPPTALFAAQTSESVAVYVETITDRMFFETVRREDTTVAGRAAVLVETVATGEGENEPGERRYGYVIDRDGRAFVVFATGLPGDARYPDFREITDEAAATAQFF